MVAPGLRRLKAYLINLDRSTDRLATMRAQLDALGLPWMRVPAVDGRKLGDLPWPGYDDRGYDRDWGKSHDPGEVGCFHSHLRAFQTFLDDGAEFGLILEDDCRFDADLADVLADLVDRSAAWDVVKLSGNHRGLPMQVETLPHGRCLVALLQRQTGSAAYLVNPRAARAYLAGLLPMNVPYDHTFDQVWRFGLTLRGIAPFPISDDKGRRSTINHSTVFGVKKAWYRRGGVAVYRARTEFRRVLHYLFTDTGWVAAMMSRRRVAGSSAS